MRSRLTVAVAALCAAITLPATPTTARSQGPRLTLTETLRLDANTEDFPSVNTAFTGPSGIVTVAIMADNQMRLYDSTGKRIASVGRKGDGPGEFQRPLRYGWVADTLWVYDSNHMRFSLIARDGKLIRTISLAAALNAGMTGRGSTDSGGVFSYVPNVYYADGASIGPGMLITGRNPQGTIDTDNFIVRASASGAITRLVRQPFSDAASVNVSRAGSSWGQAVPFVFQPPTVYAPDGSRFAFLTVEITSRTGGTYTVEVFSAKGASLLSRSYPFTGVPIPAGVIDSAVTASMARAQGRRPPDVSAELERGIRKQAPPVYAPVGSLMFGRDGTIWITQRRTAEGVVALVLNSRGDQIATALVPPRSRLLEVSLGSILVSETDDDGLTSVVRYRVSGRACGPPECG